MGNKINVAEILKDKPKGTKLYSDICCGECVLNEVSENAIYVDMYNKERFWFFFCLWHDLCIPEWRSVAISFL